jgi:hypothetical protein
MFFISHFCLAAYIFEEQIQTECIFYFLQAF